MSRPLNLRHIAPGLGSGFFGPAGTPLRDLEVVNLDLDGLEALRLADLVGLYHDAAAEIMGVSRATFGRVLAEARRRVSDALVHGKALNVGGGEVIESEHRPIPCPVHAQGRRRGRGCRCEAQRASGQARLRP